MVNFNIPKKSIVRKTVKPGEYNSKVCSVQWTKGFVKGKAFDVVYELTSDSGEVYEHSEMFYTTRRNSRTADFYDYLEANGIETSEAFVGCRERLTFLKDVRDNKTHISIVHRVFVGKSEGDLDVGVQG